MRQHLKLLALLSGLLAACGHTPSPRTPEPDSPPGGTLAPLVGSVQRDEIRHLTRHSTGVYAAGHTTSSLFGQHQGQGDAFVAKYDAAGNRLWGRQFGTSNLDEVWGVATDAQDNVYVAGRTTGDLAGHQGGDDGYIRKYTASGGVAWTRQIGTRDSDEVSDIAVDAGGNVYVTLRLGSRRSTARYSTDGVRLWTRHSGACVGAVAVNGSGDVVTAGPGAGGVCLSKLNAGGGVLWRRETPTNAFIYDLHLAVYGDDAYVASTNAPLKANRTIFVARYAGEGVLQWQYPSLGFWMTSDSAFDVSATAEGVYIGGYRYSQVTSRYGGLVIKIGADGGWKWSKTVYSGAANPTGTYGFAVVARTVRGGVIGQGAGAQSLLDKDEVYTGGYSFDDLGAGYLGGGDAYLRRLDGATGDTVWTR